MPARTHHTAPALAPVDDALAAVRRRRGPEGTGGLADGLVVADVADPAGWLPASDLVSGEALDDLLAAAGRFWRAEPHAAAALAWRMYTYWLVMPPVLGWATARRVPLLDPGDVLVRINDRKPFVTVGLRRVRVATLPTDPLAAGPEAGGAPPGGPSPDAAPTGTAEVVPVGGERELLAVLRATLRTGHLDPLLARIQDRVRLGTRTLLGSLASAVAYAVVRGVEAAPDEIYRAANTLLSTLDVADLVTLEPGADGHPAVWRHTCCLAFTIPEPKICSGCPLRRSPAPPL